MRPPETVRTPALLALLTDGFGSRGGIGQYNRDLLRALSESGGCASIVVLPRTGDAAADAPPARVQQLPARAGKLPYAAQALRTAATGRFDVVFCGHLHMAPLAALVAQLSGARLWLQLHGIEAWAPPSALVQQAVRRADLTTCVSRHTRRRFLAWARLEPHTVKVLPNTVEPRFTPGPASGELRARLDLAGRRVLLTVSRLAAAERYKGHDAVLRALALLLPQHPDLAYVVAGDGDDLPRLRQRAQELGVAHAVRFAGYVPDEELPGLYRAADVFVMPSSGEGFGIVFLQALASGVPVVAGDADGSRDPLRDGTEGELVPAHEVPQLAAAILRRLGQRGVAGSADRFAPAVFGRQAARLAATLFTGAAP